MSWPSCSPPKLAGPLEEVGRLRGQAPVKPLHYKAAAGKAEAGIQQWLEQADKVLENG